MEAHNQPVLSMSGATVWLPSGKVILHTVDWTVSEGEHWVVLGTNGSGKSTLLSLAAAARHPSDGTVTILGAEMGRCSVWELRQRLGVVDAGLPLYEWFTVEEVVLTGATGTIQPRWDCYGPEEHERARYLLNLLGCGSFADREIGTLSMGERQRVRIARALMPDPALLLLDEPATGLDLPAREALIAALGDLRDERTARSSVLVSHHVEEIPATTTHALLLLDGMIVEQGEVDRVLDTQSLSECFGVPIEVRRADGRWSARASAGWRPGRDQGFAR